MNDSAHSTAKSHQGWIYDSGDWRLGEDPVLNRPEAEEDLAAAIKAAGYETWTAVGKEYMTPLTLTVWARPQEPSYLFDLEGALHFEWVYARTLPDALALLNQLAPTLQALTITDQIAGAEPKTMSVLADLLDTLHGRRRDTAGRIVER